MKARQERVQQFSRLGNSAATIMEVNKVAENGVHTVKVANLKELLKWKLFYAKDGVRISGNKAKLVEMWSKYPLPAAEETWTAEDAALLEQLDNEEVNIAQMALGKEQARAADVLAGGIESGQVPQDALDAIQKALEARRKAAETSSNREAV